MAEIYPDEGLDVILAIFPKGGATLAVASQFVGLWTSFTASTVGAYNNTRTDYAETNYGSYARTVIPSWGSPADGDIGGAHTGRKVVAGQVTMPTATSNGAAAINGFGLYDASTLGHVLFAANFDDTTAVTMNTNDIIKVTPTIQFNH